MDTRDPKLSRTDWSMFAQLRGEDRAQAAEALDTLVRRYWPAIYAFIRRTGRDVHDAHDLTQAFVADIVIDRELGRAADPGKGRFRSLLLRSVRNFLRDQNRRTLRSKRPASERRAPITPAEVPAVDGEGSPEEAFDRIWSQTLVRTVLRRVEEQCRREGFEAHWSVFDARVVQPILGIADPIPYAVLATMHDLPSAEHAANMVITVKRRFARALRQEIASTVMNADDVDDELREIVGLIEVDA